MKQARRHIFQPTFPPTPKHTCRGGGGGHTRTKMERGTGGEKITRPNFFPLNCPSCSSLPVGIWPETSPTADRRNRSPGSTEKSVSMFSNVAVRSQSGTVPPPQPRKVLFFLLLFFPLLLRPFLPPLALSSVRYSSCCRWFSRSMFSFLRVSVFFASSGLSRGHHTLFHAEGVRERERERVRGRERERECSGESMWRHEAGVDWIKNK